MSNSQKISELEELLTPSSEDLLVVVDSPTTTPKNKNITLGTLFGSITSNVNITNGRKLVVSGNTTFNGTSNQFLSINTGNAQINNLTISSNGVIITTPLTPANSSIGGIPVGKIFWDQNYLYIRTSNTTIKRVLLSSF